jgi:transcriptional regulator GlxA family with amidase domain
MSNEPSTIAQFTSARPLVVGAVLFPDFELLDVFGPLEIFGLLRERSQSVTLAEHSQPVRSSAGPSSVIDRTLDQPGKLDVLLIPGGIGTRREVENTAFLAKLRTLAEATPFVGTICTGTALLARTCLLDGRQATSNKVAFKWVVTQGPSVKWVPSARWVEDDKYFTSSGVSAGIDMSLGLVTRLFDRATAVAIAQRAEYEWHEDKSWDPFAKIHGLVP